MKDEIKEILEYYKRTNKNHFGYEQDKIITYKEAHLLLDYITNLQEENEKAIELLNREYWINEHEHNDKVIDDVLNILQGGDK